MRGADHQQSSILSYISPEQRVPKDDPLRAIRTMAGATLKKLDADFDAIYAERGRPSIAPETLLRALLLQVLYTVQSATLADGAVGLQLPVSLVRETEHR